MDENQVKEAVSRTLFTLLASYKGYKVVQISPDNGCDVTVEKVVSRPTRNGKVRLVDSGHRLRVQLKSTTEERGIIQADGSVKYKLENKTFNDLVYSLNTQMPLLLVLLVLPSERTDWVTCETDCIKAQKYLYWYSVDPSQQLVENEASKTTITIPAENRLATDTIDTLFDNFVL